MGSPCEKYTPETCPCNRHSAARAEARQAKRDADAAAAVVVKPLEDAAPEPPAKWEPVVHEDFHHTDRLRVPGGWIYRAQGNGLVFVPDPS